MAAPREIFLEELEERLRAMLTAFAGGRDVAPATLYRLEGFIESGITLGLTDSADVQRCISDLVRDILGEDAVADFAVMGAGRLPMRMQKAPVYPSGSGDQDR